MKRLLSCILAIAMLAIPLVQALAAGGRLAELRLEQYYADMPRIDVWFYPVDSDGNCIDDLSLSASDIEAYLGGNQLKVVSVERGISMPTVYVVLLDISLSTGKQFFKNFKQALAERVSSLSGEDELILITMGDTVDVLLDGTESAEEAAAAILALEQQSKEQDTQYYKALNEAINKAERLADGTRCVLVTVSDGLNSADSTYTSEGTLERMTNAKLPMYTIGVGRSDNMAQLQELAAFTEKTNGAYIGVSNADKNDEAKVREALGEVFDTIGACYIVGLLAESNSVTGSELRLKVDCSEGSAALNINDFRIDSWQSDTEAPAVESVEIVNPYTLKFKFTEAVLGADSPANYVITDPEGVPAAIESAVYDKTALTSTVKLAQPLYDGEYSVGCINITDDSIEKNALEPMPEGMARLVQEGNPAPTAEPEPETDPSAGVKKSWFDQYGLFVILGAVMLALLVAILIVVSTLKKRRSAQAAEAAADEGMYVDGGAPGSSINTAKVNLAAVNGKNVDLTVVEKNGVARDVSMFIADSCIIGRSAAVSDLTIEDQRISRQHCVLCWSNGEILINDLQSANGTAVNGIKVTDFRKLMPNDTITIGSTKIIVKTC